MQSRSAVSETLPLIEDAGLKGRTVPGAIEQDSPCGLQPVNALMDDRERAGKRIQ